jgi:hypothetical protein
VKDPNLQKSWAAANQCYLVSALAVVRARLESHAARRRGDSPNNDAAETAEQILQAAKEAMPAPAAFDRLCAVFGLSSFERDLLLLCAGIELDSSFGPLCARAQGDPQKPYPTFSLALAALPDAHWSALSPAGPLRYWRLVEVGGGTSVAVSPLRIDERILHFLAGVSHLDERFVGLLDPVHETDCLVPSRQDIAGQIAGILTQSSGQRTLPVVQLLGEETATKQSIAGAACAALGLNLHMMSAFAVPLNPVELDTFLRLWEREAALSACALLLDCHELEASDAARGQTVKRLIESIRGPLFVATPARRPGGSRRWISYDVAGLAAAEQRVLWAAALGERAAGLNGQLDRLIAQFQLGPASIGAAAAEALSRSGSGASNAEEELSCALWTACRAHARPRLDDLAQQIDPRAGWDDLVLPAAQLQTLRDIAMHVRQRAKVYEAWGFAGRCARGLGISALFTGASGTGKTMAAEVLANELQLDLYRIDLSQVVSKYIGETEKNLRRVFDAAEKGGSILLFDEADALFGKRSEVKDSHDRYANIEVSYLLQRMESYRGLAILTTNLKGGLDTAFQRRIRFIVQFPYPGPEDRTRIWQRIFPADTPTENLDISKLARLNVAGGNIRNIALNAAFRAADAREPVRMVHLLNAARSECFKLEKPMTEVETGEWI